MVLLDTSLGREYVSTPNFDIFSAIAEEKIILNELVIIDDKYGVKLIWLIGSSIYQIFLAIVALTVPNKKFRALIGEDTYNFFMRELEVGSLFMKLSFLIIMRYLIYRPWRGKMIGTPKDIIGMGMSVMRRFYKMFRNRGIK